MSDETRKDDLQSIIDDGLEKPKPQKMSELVDDALEVEQPKSIGELLAEQGITEVESLPAPQTPARPSQYEDPESIEIPVSKKPEPETQEPIKEEKPTVDRSQLDEILVRALEKAKEEEPVEEIEETGDGLVEETPEEREELIDSGEAQEKTEEWVGGSPEPEIEDFATQDDYLRSKVIGKNAYETEWVEIEDFKSTILGEEIGQQITHNLDSDPEKLEVKVVLRITDKFSTKVLEEVNLEVNNISNGRGVAVRHVDKNNLYVVTAEAGVNWVVAFEKKALLRSSDNIDFEKYRAYYKVVVTKPIDVERLVQEILARQPKGFPMFPDVTAGVPSGAPAEHDHDAADVDYDNTASGLDAVNVQDAIDEIVDEGVAGIPQVDILGAQISANKPIKPGIKGYRQIPYNATIKSWAIIVNSAGGGDNITFDIKTSTLAGYPTTTSIIGNPAYKPTISGAYSAWSDDLTSWNTSLTKDDIMEFVVDSASGVTFAALFISIERDNP
jgi:hypothetical protein